MVEIIRKELPEFIGEAWLVKTQKPIHWGGRYKGDDKGDTQFFVVSGVKVMFSGWEVLVFPADENGVVLDWGEVCGRRGMTYEEAIELLEELERAP